MPIYERQRDREREKQVIRRFCRSLGSDFTFKTTEPLYGYDARIFRLGKLYAYVEATSRKVKWMEYPDVRRDRTKLENLVKAATHDHVTSYFLTSWADGKHFAIELSIESFAKFQTWTQTRKDRLGELPDNVYAIPKKYFVAF